MSDKQSHASLPPWLVMGFGILTISTGSILVRYAQGYAPSLVIAAARMVIASLLLAPLAWFRHRPELASLTRREWALALVSGVFLALHFATWITSLEYTTVASSVVLVTTTPLWVSMLAPFVLKEPLTRRIAAGMVFALAGSVVVGLSDACSWEGLRLVCPPGQEWLRGRALLGDLLALAGAIMAAAYVLIGRRLRARLSLVGYIFVVYSVAALVLVALAGSAGYRPGGYPLPAYGWFVLLAVVPQLLGHSSFNWALGYVPAAVVSVSLLGEPIGSTILAYFLLSEVPSALKGFGAILILAGILLASTGESQSPVPGAPTS